MGDTAAKAMLTNSIIGWLSVTRLSCNYQTTCTQAQVFSTNFASAVGPALTIRLGFAEGVPACISPLQAFEALPAGYI